MLYVFLCYTVKLRRFLNERSEEILKRFAKARVHVCVRAREELKSDAVKRCLPADRLPGVVSLHSASAEEVRGPPDTTDPG